MPKTRQQKETLAKDVSDKLQRGKSVAFASISGFTMQDADKLRGKGREQEVELAIIKKTLLLRALQVQGISLKKMDLPGSILAAIGYADEVSPAKILAEYAKDNEGTELAGGILEGVFVDAKSIKVLALLPGREELLAKMVGSLNAPISGIVQVLAGNLRKLVYALNAIKEAKA